MATRWLPVAFALHVVHEWGQGHGHGSGTGYFGFLPFLSSTQQKPEHPRGYSLATLGGICPSRAICLLTIARTLNRHQGREQCANVPLTPSSKQTAPLPLHLGLCTSCFRSQSWPERGPRRPLGMGLVTSVLTPGAHIPLAKPPAAPQSSLAPKWVDLGTTTYWWPFHLGLKPIVSLNICSPVDKHTTARSQALNPRSHAE